MNIEAWLSFLHSPWLLALLFGGAMADAIIGVGFFIYGEVFFLLGGYAIASGHGYWIVLLLWSGAWAGDLLSYWLGHKYGKSLLYGRLKKSKRLRANYRKARSQLHQRQKFAIFSARLLGPLSWVMPFIAGVAKVQPRTFMLYSGIGVLIGTTQFIVVGYLLHQGISMFDNILLIVREYQYVVIASLIAVIVSGWLIKNHLRTQRKEGKIKLVSKVTTVWLVSFITMNYSYFFVSNAHATSPKQQIQPLQLDAISELDFQVYAGSPKLNHPQPINLVLVTDKDLRQLHEQLGWIENKTFSSDKLSFRQYVGLLKQGTPPVSDLYHQGYPQHYAFQPVQKSDLINREHVRWWRVGKTEQGKDIYLGSVSRDNEVEIKPYKGVITLLHDIDPNVDSSRVGFNSALKNAYPSAVMADEALAPKISKHQPQQDYWTDGLVTVIEL